MAELLRERGYDVATVSSAEQAASSVQNRTPDAVVADAVPHGIDALRELEQARVRVPSIIVSGLPAFEPRIEAAIRQLRCAYLPKPLDLARLMAWLRSATRSRP